MMTASDVILQFLKQALAKLDLPPAKLNLEHPADPKNGDYASSVALNLFPKLAQGSYQNPRQLAEAIVREINQLNRRSVDPSVSRIDVAGPGFINFYLTPAYLLRELKHLAGGQLVTTAVIDQKVIVEYSSPNIAKPFTIGHLRSTIIGDVVANLLQKVGWTVYRDNHLGDWGTQFGKQIYAIKTWGNEAEIAAAKRPVKLLVELYVKFHEEAEKDPRLEDEARAWFKKLEDGDQEARRLWQKCIDWSWKEFAQIYQQLGVCFTENGGRGYGESFFEDQMTEVVEELKHKKLLTESKGAQVVFFPHDQYPPLMIIKKDGATLYATRDLATDKFRLHQYGPEVMIINEVGAEQSLYFQQLFQVEKMLSWVKDGQRIHIGHGLYRFKDQKMSTRKGNVIWLEDVFAQALERVQKQAKDQLSDEDAWKIAIGALKWHDLKRNALQNVVFDWDEITNFQGNSGPYLQYTYVRCISILQKANRKYLKDIDLPTNLKSEMQNGDIAKYFDYLINRKVGFDDSNLNQEEIDLLRLLYQYSEVVNLAAHELSPHHLCTYLYALAQSLNRFYVQHQVVPNSDQIDWPTLELRLLLVYVVALIIKDGLNLLGIQTVAKM